MSMSTETLGLVSSVVYAVGMFSGAALERFILAPRRKRLDKES